jgi:hypothetical protein
MQVLNCRYFDASGTLMDTCNVEFSSESGGFQTQVRALSISTNNFSMSRVLAMSAVLSPFTAMGPAANTS